MTRIYQSADLNPGSILNLDESASHHLSRVLRANPGDSIIIFNGKGGEYTAVITQINKKGVEIKMGEYSPREAESPLKIQLAQGWARGEKMDFIMQKAVELGVVLFTPLITSRCNVKLDPGREKKRVQHWQSIIISACEQSGRNFLPLLESPVDFADWISSAKADYRFVLSPHVDKKLPATIPAESTVILLIGPEGGLTEEEMEVAIKNGFIPLNLGKRVLRTETASIAAIAALQTRFGDFCD